MPEELLHKFKANSPAPAPFSLDPNQVPTFGDITKGLNTNINMDNGYGNVIATIKRAGTQPGLTQTALPEIMKILSPDGQATSPYAAKINQQTNMNVAQAQSDMMKRGLTGSDIEATAMGGARAAGQESMAQMYAQTANQLSQYIFQAATGDLNQNRELILTLAQAMGQELTSQRDMYMFQQALKASIEQAERARRSARNSGIGGMIGGIAGAAGGAMGLPGGPTVWSGIGSSAGSAIGGNQP